MNSFFKKSNNYEMLRYEFEHDMNIERAYISEKYYYNHDSEDKYAYELNCTQCHNSYEVGSLTFKDKKIHCKCGASYAVDELRPEMHDYVHYYSYGNHNILNGTINKVSISTLLNAKKLYCTHCHRVYEVQNLELDNKQRICKCGAKHSFDDLKIIAGNCNTSFTSGDVYFDGHKITMSFLEYYSDINANGQYYWQSGGQRLTMNLETGFSYLTNSGYRYREYNRLYRRENGKNAPTMFNCTYSSYTNTLELVARAKADSLISKYINYPNLIQLMHKMRFEKIIFNKLIKQIDDYMTAYYNNKYSYRIKSLMELSEGSFKSYHAYLLPLRNRFINLNLKQLDSARYVLENVKHLENKRNYGRLSRETNDLWYEYVCKTTKLSKNLRKTIYAEMQSVKYFPHLVDIFTVFTRFFKNKENVNKIYKTFKEADKIHRLYTYKVKEDVMKLWMNYRNEQYLSNLSFKEIFEKVNHMYDALNLIIRIRRVYGADWDLNSVKFHTEKQFHDDLIRITSTEEFIELLNKEKAETELKPFELENEILELEDEPNNIFIARNRAMLTNIGQAMGICVGGYGGQVECGHCRIAYIKINGAYEVCIELTRSKNPETKKWEYTMVQAKLRYNDVAANKPFYYNIVKEWADNNNIKINTYDMKVVNKKAVCEF